MAATTTFRLAEADNWPCSFALAVFASAACRWRFALTIRPDDSPWLAAHNAFGDASHDVFDDKQHPPEPRLGAVLVLV